MSDSRKRPSNSDWQGEQPRTGNKKQALLMPANVFAQYPVAAAAAAFRDNGQLHNHNNNNNNSVTAAAVAMATARNTYVNSRNDHPQAFQVAAANRFLGRAAAAAGVSSQSVLLPPVVPLPSLFGTASASASIMNPSLLYAQQQAPPHPHAAAAPIQNPKNNNNNNNNPTGANEDTTNNNNSIHWQQLHGQQQLQMQQALDLIPEKAAYLEAMFKCPFLVATESPAIRFLRHEHFLPAPAAARLVQYWNERKGLFGAERAFLPMDTTGQGALNAQDVAVVDTNFLVILPPDQDNRCVWYYNRLQLGDKIYFSYETKLRAFFYAAQLVSEHASVQTDGLILLAVLDLSSTEQARSGMASCMRILRHAFPVRCHSIQLCPVPRQGRKQTYRELFLSRIGKVLGSVFWGVTSFHLTDSKEELCNKLEMHGLEKSRLPEILGGIWQYQSYEPFKFNRMLLERERHEQFLARLSSQDTKPAARSSEVPVPVSTSNSNVQAAAFQESEQVQQKALLALEEAIELIPAPEKAALLEARQLIPDRVNKEADPIRFLRFESYNTWAAARRLATYWDRRKQVFKDRAFLPMNQTGEGTLNRDDTTLLSRARLALLPNDSHGRAVVYGDSSRNGNATVETRKRVAFYLLSIVCENDMTQKDGCVFIGALGDSPIDEAVAAIVALLREALPCRVHKFHIVTCTNRSVDKAPSKSVFRTWARKAFAGFIGHVMDKHAEVHDGTTADELGQTLPGYGLVKENLPTWMGGSWDYNRYALWLDLRMRYEWGLPVVGSSQQSVDNVPSYTTEQFCDLTEEDKTERRRKMNVYHSRRKRVRQKIEAEVLNDQASELRRSNEKLARENQRYEELLKEAEAKIASMDESELCPENSQPVAAAQSTVAAHDVSNVARRQSPIDSDPTLPSNNPLLHHDGLESDSLNQRVAEEAASRQSSVPVQQSVPLQNPLTTAAQLLDNLGDLGNVGHVASLPSYVPEVQPRQLSRQEGMILNYLRRGQAQGRHGASQLHGQDPSLANAFSLSESERLAAAIRIQAQALGMGMGASGLSQTTMPHSINTMAPNGRYDPAVLLGAMNGYSVQPARLNPGLFANPMGVSPWMLATQPQPLASRDGTGNGVGSTLPPQSTDQQQQDPQLWEQKRY